MNWTTYRWQEGSVVIDNHINYIEGLENYVTCTSYRLADFCIKKIFPSSTNKL